MLTGRALCVASTQSASTAERVSGHSIGNAAGVEQGGVVSAGDWR